MTQITYLNADEMSALQGLSLEAKVLYVFELRRYADAHGITGMARRHSYQSFIEQLTVVPDWGSKSKQPEITMGKVRAVLSELERHGLIEKVGSLVFSLTLASQDKSVQKRNDRGTTPVATGRATGGTTGRKAYVAMDLEEGTTKGATRGTTDENAEERHTSPITKTATTTAREDDVFQEQVDTRRKFAMTLNWQPTTGIQQRAGIQGVSMDKITTEVIGKFVSHYEASGQMQNQSQWENLLIRWAKRERSDKPASHAAPKEVTQNAPVARLRPVTSEDLGYRSESSMPPDKRGMAGPGGELLRKMKNGK